MAQEWLKPTSEGLDRSCWALLIGNGDEMVFYPKSNGKDSGDLNRGFSLQWKSSLCGCSWKTVK